MGYLEGNSGSSIYVGADSSTYNSATVRIKGLGATANSYDGFGVYYQAGSNSASGWNYVTLYNSNTNYETSTVTITGLPPNTRIYFVARANFRGTWYYGGETYLTTPSAPTPSTPTLSVSSIDGKVIKINVSTGSNTSSVYFDHYDTMPWGSRYQTVSIGSNTTYTYTFNVPNYQTAYRLDCQARSPEGNTSSWSTQLHFTSGQMMPQITSVSVTNVSGKKAFFLVGGNEMAEFADVDYNWVSGYPDATFSLTPNGTKFIDVIAPEYGKQYGVDFQAKTGEGIKASSWTGFYYFWTKPENIGNFWADGRTKTDITMKWDGAQGAVAYRIKAVDANTGVQKFYTRTTNLYATCTGLESGKFYNMQIQSENQNGDLSDVKTVQVATRESIPPEIYMEVPTGNTSSITVTARGIDRLSGINYIRAYVSGKNIADGWAYITKYPQNIMETENLSFLFLNDGSGLKFEMNQTYYFKAEAVDNDGNTASTGNFTFVPKNARPANFSWNVTWTSGSTFNLKASQWNKLTQSINDFRVYKGMATIWFETVTTGQTFTAQHYNDARNAIASMNSNGIPSTVSKGNTVTAWHLNQLANVLNAIP
ncbi:leukemia inhibitory factor receptor [Bacillus phage vB_BanS_Sophrita]|uniref:Leukemia inhibitory factor receptor n=1 Tax=Bacillus phage vB_BanS_Sophrita TaxID=2894790 RepID=A0AAE8YXE2_9CAUD|nr:leukemia inhibitory factor receptor [Bacillus phage vB_BanS_Sophrita]UGO50794.1 leukemia inhibitory factor receptor [Bacillus phage vB_BanS_Sophrita]